MRATESEESFERRISKAEEEMKTAENFDIILPNDDLDAALKQAEQIVKDFIKS